MEESFRWPKKGDNPFLVKSTDRNSPTWTFLHWLTLQNFDDSLLAGAFKESGDKIIKDLNKGEDTNHPDKFFIPIAYLYRHSLELKMKHMIRLGIELGLIEEDKKISDVLREHKLDKLWNYVKKILEKRWHDSPKETLSAVERIIQVFHNMDMSGQNLRYSEKLSGGKTLNHLPESVQLTHMRDIFAAVFNFLNGCEATLEDELEMKAEVEMKIE